MNAMTKTLTFAAAALALSACTTKPLTVDTPGPGATTVQVPVPATRDITLTSQVRSNLDTGLGTDAVGIEIRVEEGNVFLTGKVATAALRTKAIAIAVGDRDRPDRELIINRPSDLESRRLRRLFHWAMPPLTKAPRGNDGRCRPRSPADAASPVPS